jgi:hypothetical protein
MNGEKGNESVEQLDRSFNKIRSQLDFLVESAKYQNTILKKLYENAYDCSDKSEDSNNKSCE